MRLIAVLLACLYLSACASIVSGTQQTVFVDTPLMQGASCKLTDSKSGTWYLPASPGSVTVQKGNGPMNVACEKAGYSNGMATVDEELAGATFGNIILGGGVGIFIDAMTGAAQKYPDKFVVWLKPTAWTSPEDELAWNEEKRKYDEAEAQAKAAKEAQASQTTELERN